MQLPKVAITEKKVKQHFAFNKTATVYIVLKEKKICISQLTDCFWRNNNGNLKMEFCIPGLCHTQRQGSNHTCLKWWMYFRFYDKNVLQ